MKKQILNITICCILLTVSLLYAGDIYKCTDKNGNVKFSDKPCDPDEDSTTVISHEKEEYPEDINLESEIKNDTETAEPESLKTLSAEKESDESVEHSEDISPGIKTSDAETTGSEPSEALPWEKKSEETEKDPEVVSLEQAEIKTADSGSTEPDSSKALSGKVSIQVLVDSLGRVSPYILFSVFVFPSLIVLLISRMHKKWYGNTSPWQYIYSFFVYLVSIPGMFACVLTFYSLFFIRQNLLNVNIFIYFLPIMSMIVTLALISRNAVLSKLPGIDRLFALMTILFISFSAAFALQRTRIWLFFGGSFIALIIITLICFVLLKVSMHRLFRQK